MKLKEKIRFGAIQLTEATKRTRNAPGKVRGEFYLDYMGDKMELATILPSKFFTEEVTPPAGVKVETIEFVSKSKGQYGIGWDFVFSAEVEMTDAQIEDVLSFYKEIGEALKEWRAKRREIDALQRQALILEDEARTFQEKMNCFTFSG